MWGRMHPKTARTDFSTTPSILVWVFHNQNCLRMPGIALQIVLLHSKVAVVVPKNRMTFAAKRQIWFKKEASKTLHNSVNSCLFFTTKTVLGHVDAAVYFLIFHASITVLVAQNSRSFPLKTGCFIERNAITTYVFGEISKNIFIITLHWWGKS
jgi:hypothetical protein